MSERVECERAEENERVECAERHAVMLSVCVE